MARLVQAGLYLLVASIPFEYPERSIPLEIPTLTGAVFLLATIFHPRACYSNIPPAALWFAGYLAAFLVSVTATRSEYASEAVEEFVIVLQGVLVLLAAGNLMRDEKVARRAMMTFVAACAIRAALPLLGFARTADAVWTGGERLSALGQNANSAAMILSAGLVALIGLTFIKHRKNWVRLLGTGLLGALIGLAVLETGSRGGLAALLGGMLVFAVAAGSMRHRIRNGVIALVVISLLTFAAFRLPMMKNRVEDSFRTGNLAGREQLYPALWIMFLERPILGWGPVANTYELAQRIGERGRPHRAAHNIILELLTATGIVGAIPFLIGGLLCIRGAWHARRGEHGVLPLALIACLLIANMSGDWIASKLVWLALAYALASGSWRAPAVRLGMTVSQARRQLGGRRAPLAAAPMIGGC